MEKWSDARKNRWQRASQTYGVDYHETLTFESLQILWMSCVVCLLCIEFLAIYSKVKSNEGKLNK